jgi:branched-chain amino acid transport system permease protein
MTSTEAIQYAVDGIIDGSFYALIGAGMGLILGVTGRFHLAFATSLALAPYLAITLVSAGLPLYVAIVLGLIGGTALGVVIELFIYRPLALKSPTTALLAVFVSGLGISIAAENLMSVIWGSNPRPLSPGFTVSRISLGGKISITNLDVMVMGVATAALVLFWLYMNYTRQGRAIRGVRSNPELATVVGVNSGSVFVIVFAIGSLAASIGGILFTMRYAASPDMGDTPTFDALVVAFLAGLHSTSVRSGPARFAIAGLAIGVIPSLSELWISSSWETVVTFGLLFVYIGGIPLASGSWRTWWSRVRPATQASG